MTIRHARRTDHTGIAEINTLAFGKPDEAALIQRLRDDGDVMFELVAEVDGVLEGHILFSRLWADNGRFYAALAPMAVRPALQTRGIGSALVRSSLDNAREFGAHGVLVLGLAGCAPSDQQQLAQDKARFVSQQVSGHGRLTLTSNMDPAMRALALRFDPGQRRPDLWARARR